MDYPQPVLTARVQAPDAFGLRIGRSAALGTSALRSACTERHGRLEPWLRDELLALLKRAASATIRYARSRELTRYLDNGRLEISNNAVENAIRPVGARQENWLFDGMPKFRGKRPPLAAVCLA